MSHIIYNVAAKCDKAGRSQNQDNYWVCPNLEKIGDISNVGNDHDIELSAKGALLVVADGMGGMKSGEKASEFVIEGIKKKFSNIPEDILGNDNAIISFIKEAIVESDGIIKAYAKDHRESEGMGSTIVLVWLLGEKAYCGWCGDSRIYCYNPQNTLVRLSHDHSYVQSLVDEGKISEEDAFDHPDGNIITRSLGDSGEKANPETKIYPIHRRDVFLLCSDGLCGLLTDENIESLLSDNCTSSEDALKALWQAGEKEGWSDNVTIEVACVTDGGATPTRKAVGYSEKKPQPLSEGKSDGIKKDTNLMPNFWANNKQYFIIVGVVALIAIGLIWYFSIDKKQRVLLIKNSMSSSLRITRHIILGMTIILMMKIITRKETHRSFPHLRNPISPVLNRVRDHLIAIPINIPEGTTIRIPILQSREKMRTTCLKKFLRGI